MTPRYISAVYDVDPDALAAVLGLPPGGDPRDSIARIAAASGRPTAEVLDRIETLIEEGRDAE